MEEKFKFLVGIDWGGERHQICVLDDVGKVRGERSVAHDGQALGEVCAWLLTVCGCVAGAIAAVIEVPYGPVVETLLEHGFAVFFIHPKQLDRFRDRFTAAGAKDDRRDAHTAADALRTDRDHLRRLAIRDPLTIRLCEWRRIYAELSDEHHRLIGRLYAQLWRYYPAFLKVGDDLAALWLVDLWDIVPSPTAAVTADREEIARLLKRCGVRRFDADSLLALLRQTPLLVAPGTAEAAEAHIRLLMQRLRLLHAQQRQAQMEIDALLAQWDQVARLDPVPVAQDSRQISDAPRTQPVPGDAEILRSIPGVGRIVLATVLTEGADAVRQRDYGALRLVSGVAPVTRQSGKMRIVHRRYACSHLLRNAVHDWARIAVRFDVTWRSRYDELRGRKQSHARVLRTIGDRLLAVACAMLKAGTLYDPKMIGTTRA